MFATKVVTSRLLAQIELNEKQAADIARLQGEKAAAVSELQSTQASMDAMRREHEEMKKQLVAASKETEKLSLEMKEKEAAWRAEEEEHFDGNLLMYSYAWKEFKEKAEGRHPGIDLEGFKTEYPLHPKIFPPEDSAQETILPADPSRGDVPEVATEEGEEVGSLLPDAAASRENPEALPKDSAATDP